MSNLIANFFQNLGDPQKRKEILQTALGGDQQPANTTTPPARGLRGFANALGAETYSLGVQAGMDVKPLPPVESDVTKPYVKSIIGTESGGNWAAKNNEQGAGGKGHFGRSQFGRARFAEAQAAGAVPSGMTIEQFAQNTPEAIAAQKRAEAWHYADLENQLGDLVGVEVNGKPMDMGALVAMGHLGGAGGARRYVESGGRYNPSDAFGTSLADYAIAHGGSGSGVPLSYGEDIEAVDPMTEEYIGRMADQPLSMGMDADQFALAKRLYGERQAMEILNNTQNPNTNYPVYDDAILRYLQEEDPAETNPAQAQAEALARGGLDPYGAGGYSMGYEVPATATTGATAGGAASVSPPAGAAPATTASAKDAPPEADLTKVDKMLNILYGTDVEDMSDDERADRRRAMGIALTQGFQMLSRGTPMDIQGVVQQRMDLQATRRASADLKNNAQAVSDMLAASGMPELAQLPFAGEAGMGAAMQALVTRSAQQTGGGETFDLPPSVRATMAQTLADMGHAGLAQQVMEMPPGKALEDLYGSVLGVATTPPKGGEGGSAYSPEQRERIAAQFEAAGNPVAAEFVRTGVDDKTIGDLVKDQSGVAPAVAQAGGVAAVQAGVENATEAQSAEQYAAGLEAAGYAPEVVEAARLSGSEGAAKDITAAVRAKEVADAEAAALKARGEAVAALVPDDLPNSKELKEVARNARTSEDLNPVYEAIAGSTSEEKLYRLAKKDPEFMPFLTDLVRSRAGMERKLTYGERKVTAEMDIIAERMANSTLAASRSRVNTDTIRQILANPDFNPGKLQGNFVVPLQSWANSIMGEAAPEFATGMDLNGARIFETMMAETFVAASEGLKGAISDRETAAFQLTATTMTDGKTTALAQLQYRDRIVEIQQAEYNAMLDWAAEAENNGKLGDRADMIKYVNEKVGDMKVFDQVNAEDVDEWLETSDIEIGEVFEVVNPDGSSTLVPFIP